MKKMINKGEINALIFYQVLSTTSIRQFMDTSVENLYLDIALRYSFTIMPREKVSYYQCESNVQIGNQGNLFESLP